CQWFYRVSHDSPFRITRSQSHSSRRRPTLGGSFVTRDPNTQLSYGCYGCGGFPGALRQRKTDADLSGRASASQRRPLGAQLLLHAMTNILEAAKALKMRRVVYSSSASIYGQLKKPDHSLVKEDDAVTIYPTYFYRAAKTVSEWMGDFYKEK